MTSTNPTTAGQDRESKLERRVAAAARAALARQRFVCPLDVLIGIGWLPAGLVTDWRRGRVDHLEAVAAVPPPRLAAALAALHRFTQSAHLTPNDVAYLAATRDHRPLRFTADGDPATERAYRTRLRRCTRSRSFTPRCNPSVTGSSPRLVRRSSCSRAGRTDGCATTSCSTSLRIAHSDSSLHGSPRVRLRSCGSRWARPSARFFRFRWNHYRCFFRSVSPARWTSCRIPLAQRWVRRSPRVFPDRRISSARSHRRARV